MTQFMRPDSEHRRNWGYILGEIAITTVGILIALALNSWYQNHQDRISEAQLLREMRREIVADTIDMKADQSAYKLVLGSSEELPRRFHAGIAYTPDMDSIFGVQVLYRVHLSSSSAWATLKSRGVNLIDDDSLRLRVMAFYETDNSLIAVWNTQDLNIVNNSIRPYYRTHFVHNGEHGPKARARPLNYAQISHDPQLEYILAERHDSVVSTLSGYDTARQDAVWLNERIDARLKELT